MPTQKTVTVYKFDELSDSVKKKVVDKQRENFEFFYEFVLEDAKQILEMLGFYDIKISYSGFYSQGDGASFTGKFNSSKFDSSKIIEYAPKDLVLHGIAKQIKEVCDGYESVNFNLYRASHHYSHENTVGVDYIYFSEKNTNEEIIEWGDKQKDDEDHLLVLSRHIMCWIYNQLRTEYEYQMSDEQITQQLIDLDHDYLENGKIFLH